MKRIFVVHGWEGSPEGGWKPWLKKKLEEKEFNVSVPSMPDPSEPKMDEWINKLSNTVGTPDEECYFIGHSLGCITILRYLETIDKKIGGAVLVAGFTSDLGYEELSDFFKTPVNWNKIKSNCKRFVSIFSDNDPYVSTHYSEIFRENLGADTVMDNGRGHFSGGEGVKELPSALDAALKISSA